MVQPVFPAAHVVLLASAMPLAASRNWIPSEFTPGDPDIASGWNWASAVTLSSCAPLAQCRSRWPLSGPGAMFGRSAEAPLLNVAPSLPRADESVEVDELRGVVAGVHPGQATLAVELLLYSL
ncbi:hypothetical protein ABH924_003973 [Arthrobacter sp. GAS37]|uniref:hypothetical protein n=1 Tax=Arthrobacter sp. GAS37 TaxID=3156261 RepID=UPI0038370391